MAGTEFSSPELWGMLKIHTQGSVEGSGVDIRSTYQTTCLAHGGLLPSNRVASLPGGDKLDNYANCEPESLRPFERARNGD